MPLLRSALSTAVAATLVMASSAALVACAPGDSVAGASHAHDFNLPTIDGGRVRLGDHAGEVVLLAFFASWSKPSAALLRELTRLDARYRRRGLVVLAIALDGPDTLANVRAATRRSKHPVLLDADGATLNHYDAQHTVPFVVLVGAAGTVVKTWRGFDYGDDDVERGIRAALAR